METKISWAIKAGIIFAVAVVIGVVAFIIKQQYDIFTQLKKIETTVILTKDLSDGLIRSQSSYISKSDLEKLIKSNNINLDAINKDLETLQSKIKAIQITEIKTPGYEANNIPSSYVVKKPAVKPNDNAPVQTVVADPFGYNENTQWLNISEPFDDKTSVPVGKTGFSAWQKDPWMINIRPRKYSSSTVITEDQEGRIVTYTKFQINVDDKVYTIPGVKSSVSQEVPSSQFFFNPRLFLGADFGAVVNNSPKAELQPNLTLGLFSYGASKLKSDYTFGNIGVGFSTSNKNVTFILSPINFNIRKLVPFVGNTYFGPSISVDTAGNFSVMMGVKVQL
jgi:hypothetical protein